MSDIYQEWREVAARLGFGDNITEPQATPAEVEDVLAGALEDAREHDECPVMCEPCGEVLADTACPECHGAGGFNRWGALAECELCAGAGKIHPGCAEASYADLVEQLRTAKADALREAAEELTDALEGYCRPPHGAEQAEIAHLARALLLSRADRIENGETT